MGIPDHLTCLLRILYVGQEAIITTRYVTVDWFQIGKGVSRLYIVILLHIKKLRHYFANKGLSSQSCSFSSSMYVCESWTIKKAEHQRIDTFEL